MTSGNVSYIGPEADARYRLSTSGFGDGVLDKQQKSTIYSLVQEEVLRLTSSGKLTISHTFVNLTTANLTVEWRIRQGSSLTVTRYSTVSLADLSMSVPTNI